MIKDYERKREVQLVIIYKQIYYPRVAPDVVKPGPERIHVRLWESNHWVKASVSLVDLGALIMRKVR